MKIIVNRRRLLKWKPMDGNSCLRFPFTYRGFLIEECVLPNGDLSDCILISDCEYGTPVSTLRKVKDVVDKNDIITHIDHIIYINELLKEI